MIILDTNVVSELWKPMPDLNVVTWVSIQIIETLYLTSITVAELRSGLAQMPAGKRRARLQDRLEEELLPALEGRILPFDLNASQAYADLAVKARATGKGFPMPDGYIAAIAASKGFIVATRDASAFDAAGIEVINPWTIPVA